MAAAKRRSCSRAGTTAQRQSTTAARPQPSSTSMPQLARKPRCCWSTTRAFHRRRLAPPQALAGRAGTCWRSGNRVWTRAQVSTWRPQRHGGRSPACASRDGARHGAGQCRRDIWSTSRPTSCGPAQGGKVYCRNRPSGPAQNFFRRGNLIGGREIGLAPHRRAVEDDVRSYRVSSRSRRLEYRRRDAPASGRMPCRANHTHHGATGRPAQRALVRGLVETPQPAAGAAAARDRTWPCSSSPKSWREAPRHGRQRPSLPSRAARAKVNCATLWIGRRAAPFVWKKTLTRSRPGWRRALDISRSARPKRRQAPRGRSGRHDEPGSPGANHGRPRPGPRQPVRPHAAGGRRC